MTFSPVAADREGVQADVQETKRGVILFRKCHDAALFGCDLSHAFVASGIKSPSTVLLYLEVKSPELRRHRDVQQFVIGSRPITSGAFQNNLRAQEYQEYQTSNLSLAIRGPADMVFFALGGAK
jgi:hypothetical protein